MFNSGAEVGRYVVDVRICSCPGRDIKSEEEKFANDGSNNANSELIPIHLPMFKSKSKKRKHSVAAAEHSNPTSSVDDKDRVYNLSREVSYLLNYVAHQTSFIWWNFDWRISWSIYLPI